MDSIETYMMEMAEPEQQLSRRMRRWIRRKRYDRVPLDSSNAGHGFAVRMPRKLKIANLDFRPLKRNWVVSIQDDGSASPSVWGELRDGYVSGMAEAATARDLSLVPVKQPRSHGKSFEGVPEHKLSFTLSVLEQSYEEHLRSAFGGRYA